MNSIDKLIVLLPCHALEDFPAHHTGEAAESLLANWTALWHPALIANAGRIPKWVNTDFVDDDLDDSLILAPTVCESDIPFEVSDLVAQGRAILISGRVHRDEILASEPVARWIGAWAAYPLINDFFALGFAYLQVQLMTRKLRYSSSIDVQELSNRVLAAARSCSGQDQADTAARLATCFDLLMEEKNNYYPTEPKLLDLVLIASTTIDEKLENQLRCSHPANLLLSGADLERISQVAPTMLDSLQQNISEQKLGLVGIQQFEMPIQLVSIESLVNQIELGLQGASEFLAARPNTFASFQFGLSPQIPNLLDQFEFDCAIHASFQGGKLSNAASPTINWQGVDGSTIPAIATPPIDANQPDGFLGLGITIGEMLDAHHHCSLIFAHWPNQTNCWFKTLACIQKYGPLFGRFHTLSQFSATIYDSGFSESFAASEYRFPYLETQIDSGSRQPISKFAEYWRCFYRIRAAENLVTILAILSADSRNWSILHHRLQEWQTSIEAIVSDPSSGFQDFISQFSEFLQLEVSVSEVYSGKTSAATAHSNLCIHSLDFSRIVHLAETPSPVRKAPNRIVEIAGFEAANAAILKNRVLTTDPPVLTSDTNSSLPMLRNEYLELRIDARTGGVRSVNRHGKRGNLFSQLLAIRFSETYMQHGYPRNRSRYSQMQIDKIEALGSSNAAGTIRTTGQLVEGVSDSALPSEQRSKSNPNILAQFEQTMTLTRGRKSIEFDVTLRLEKSLAGQPWNNYACSRIAWANEDAMLFRSENEIRQPVEHEKFTAPNFVEINCPDFKLSLLPGGLPFHRRSDQRMLDTLLIVAGETETRFQFAVGVDLPTSMQAAVDYLWPIYWVHDPALAMLQGGWIFHLNCRNVIVTSTQPLFDETGLVSGCRIRIQETEGQPGELTINSPFNLTSARRINLLGNRIAELKLKQNRAFCKYSEYQFFQVELCW